MRLLKYLLIPTSLGFLWPILFQSIAYSADDLSCTYNQIWVLAFTCAALGYIVGFEESQRKLQLDGAVSSWIYALLIGFPVLIFTTFAVFLGDALSFAAAMILRDFFLFSDWVVCAGERETLLPLW